MQHKAGGPARLQEGPAGTAEAGLTLTFPDEESAASSVPGRVVRSLATLTPDAVGGRARTSAPGGGGQKPCASQNGKKNVCSAKDPEKKRKISYTLGEGICKSNI